MKRFKFVITMLLAALIPVGGLTASAAASDTIYPEDEDFIKSLKFASLDDFAVNGEIYAFAENNKVSVFDSGALTVYETDKTVTSLDCDGEKFYFSTDGGEVYSLPYSEGQQPEEYVMAENTDTVIIGNYTYRLSKDGTLKIADFESDKMVTAQGIFKNLKSFGDTAYAVCENELYSFKGDGYGKISLEYADYAATQSIAIGNTYDKLKSYSLKFVKIAAGAYMTEIDLTSLDGDFFTAGATTSAATETTALLLCYTGKNAAIVALGDTSYILLKSRTTETAVTCETEPEFDNATITGNTIYASPYVIIGTAAQPDAAGMIVKVNKKLQYENVLGSAFYEVEYTVNESTKTGYVAEGFLTAFIIEDNKKPNVVPDPDHSEKDDTTTVLLIFAVVVLVLAAVGYLAYVGTSGKRNKSRKKDKTHTNEEV